MGQTDKTTPYLGVNKADGGHRQWNREDVWYIMKKGIARTEFNQAGEVMLEGVPFSEGYDKVLDRLRSLSKEHGLPVDKKALKPPHAPAPTPKAA